MTTSFPPINYPNKPVPPFSAPAPRNPFPGFYPDMWRNITGKPYISVSSKGLANGLSEYFNDGADFGPDSLQADGSLTQSNGILEAINYAMNNPVSFDNSVVYSSPLHYWIPKVIIYPGTYFVYESMDIDIPTITKDGNTYYLANFDVSGMPGSDMNTYIYAMFNGGYLFDIDPTNIYYMDFFMSYIQPAFPTGSSYVPDGWLKMNNGNSFPSTIVLHEVNTSNSGWGSNDIDIELGTRLTLLDCKLDNPKVIMNGSIWMTGGWIFNQSSPNPYFESGSSIKLSPHFIKAPITIGSSSIVGQRIDIDTDIETPSSGPFLLLTGNAESIHIRGILNTANTITALVELASGVTSATIRYFKAIIDEGGGGGSITSYLGSGITVPAPTTPAVPTSGTSTSNSSYYPVDVCIYGGTVTEIQITRNGTAYTVFSNSTGLALSGQAYKLNPGDSITVTYTSAPDWEWLSD